MTPPRPRRADAEPSLGGLVSDLSRPRGVGRVLAWLVDLPLVGRALARGLRLPLEITAVSGPITRLHAWLLRRSAGRLRRSWLFAAGQPVLSLTTTGRRTGAPRTTAVACFVAGDDLVIAGMNLGRRRDPAWSLNLKAVPDAEIEVSGRRIRVTARAAEGGEHERLWRQWVRLQPSALRFQELAGRDIPIFVLRQA